MICAGVDFTDFVDSGLVGFDEHLSADFRFVLQVVAPDVIEVLEFVGDSAPHLCKAVDCVFAFANLVLSAVDCAFGIVVGIEENPHSEAFGFSYDCFHSRNVALVAVGIVRFGVLYILDEAGGAERKAEQAYAFGFEVVKVLYTRIHVVIAESTRYFTS